MGNIFDRILLRFIPLLIYDVGMNEDFYTIDEISQILRVHPKTIRTAIKDGHIKAFRVGIHRRSPFRIPKEELARLKLFDLKNSLNVYLKKIKEE